MAKRSYKYDSIMRLNSIESCLIDMQKSRDEIMINIGDILEREKNKFVLQREKSSSILRLSGYQKEIENQKKALSNDYQRITSLRDNIRSRRIALEDAKKRYQKESEYLEESYKILERDREALFKTSSQLFARRRELISDLSRIYPLEHTPEISPFSYKIFDIPLPNSVFDGCDEEQVATALGFASHLVQMLAYYLEAPLRFPITPMSSRSTILDPITVSLTTTRQGFVSHESSTMPLIWFFKWFITNFCHWKEFCCFSSNQLGAPFPLYLKGVDRNGFEYAVYLLNKNIEQLMNSQGLCLMDLRHTLPNLNYLILSLCSTSKSHISHLRKTIPHKCTIDETNQNNSNSNNNNDNDNDNSNNKNNNINISSISIKNESSPSKEQLNNSNNISKTKMVPYRKTNAELKLGIT